MKTVKTILVRSCKTPVLLGIGKQSEIIETVKTERKFDFTVSDPASCVLVGSDRFGSKCTLILLEEIPEDESQRMIELSCWASAVVNTLVDMSTIDEALKPAFLKVCIHDLISEVQALREADEEARETLRRSTSKLIVPLKGARNKCNDPEICELIDQKIKEVENAADKDTAKQIADAAKADNRIKPLLPDIRRTAPADNPAA